MTCMVSNSDFPSFCARYWVFAAEPDLKKNSGWKITYYEKKEAQMDSLPQVQGTNQEASNVVPALREQRRGRIDLAKPAEPPLNASPTSSECGNVDLGVTAEGQPPHRDGSLASNSESGCSPVAHNHGKLKAGSTPTALTTPKPPLERPLSEIFASIKAGMRRNRRNWELAKRFKK